MLLLMFSLSALKPVFLFLFDVTASKNNIDHCLIKNVYKKSCESFEKNNNPEFHLNRFPGNAGIVGLKELTILNAWLLAV